MGLVLVAGLGTPAWAGDEEDDAAVEVVVEFNLAVGDTPPGQRAQHVDRTAARLEELGHADVAIYFRHKHGRGNAVDPPGQSKRRVVHDLVDLSLEVSRADDDVARATHLNAVVGRLSKAAEAAGRGKPKRAARYAAHAARLIDLGVAASCERGAANGNGQRCDVVLTATDRHLVVLEGLLGVVPDEARRGILTALEVGRRGHGRALGKLKARRGQGQGQGAGQGQGQGNGRGNNGRGNSGGGGGKGKGKR
jgi:hypothetical protein